MAPKISGSPSSASFICKLGVVLVTVASRIQFAASDDPEPSKLIPLDGSQFQEAIVERPVAFVSFVAPWCGHCKSLEPELEAAAAVLGGRATFFKVDATIEEHLVEFYEVDGYPTMFLFLLGVKDKEYTGAHQKDAIVSWVLESSGPSMEVLASEQELELVLAKRGETSVIFARGDEAFRTEFEKLSSENRIFGRFVFVASENPVVRVHRGVDELAELAGEDVAEPEKLLAFLLREILPDFGQISEHNFGVYLALRRRGVLWLCIGGRITLVAQPQLSTTFEAIAQKFDQIRVVHFDAEVYSEHAKEELGCTKLPMAVLQVGNLLDTKEEPLRYRMNFSEDNVSTNEIADWVQSAFEGQIVPDDLDAWDVESDSPTAAGDQEEL